MAAVIGWCALYFGLACLVGAVFVAIFKPDPEERK